MDDKLNKAIEIISDFCYEEYGSDQADVDTSDLSKVPIAYTTYGDNDEYEIQVYVNFDNNSFETYLDNELVDVDTYPDLDSFIEDGLQWMSFDELIRPAIYAIPDEE